MSDLPSITKRRWLVRTYGFFLLGILILGLFPVFSIGIAGLIANGAGCTLNEGNVHPCYVGGIDMGDTLYTMFVLGWLMLVTIPLGAMLLVCWAVILCVHLGRNIVREYRASRQVQGGGRT
jgi:hypothetical protein